MWIQRDGLFFEKVCRKVRTEFLDEIRAATAELRSPLEQLRLAFEIWTVRSFTLTAESPDAEDLFNAGLEFAKEAMDQGSAAFEAQLAAILVGLHGAADRHPDPAQTAHILATAVGGFKVSARNCDELREMIDGLLSLVLNPVPQA